jgi:hypothetical protein
MQTYKVPVCLELVATAYVEAASAEQALERASKGEWQCYLEHEIDEVRPPDEEDVQALGDAERGYEEEVLGQRVRYAHRQAERMSQAQDHAVLHLLDAALVLLGAQGFHREKALTQAAEDCRRALGENPPAWNAMRGLLSEALEQLDTLHGITESLDDGEGVADGQDWGETRAAADELRTRIRGLLERVNRPGAPPPTVRIDVSRGVANLTSKPRGVAVEIRDYDTQGSDPAELNRSEDPDLDPGSSYARHYTGPDEEPTT